jgi:uncharacterized protein (DUF302 family)
MPDSTQSSDGVITKPSSKSVAQTIDGLRRLIADRGFTVFNVIDHSGVAERAGVQMPDSKLVMFGKPAVGAAVMLAAPLAALDIPLKVLVWEDRNGAVSGLSRGHWLRGVHAGSLRAAPGGRPALGFHWISRRAGFLCAGGLWCSARSTTDRRGGWYRSRSRTRTWANGPGPRARAGLLPPDRA